VEFYSVDVAGNAEDVQTLEIIVDNTVPEITALTLTDDDGVLTVSSATVEWTGSDAMSGIDHYEIKVDNGEYSGMGTQGKKTFGSLSDGSHTITVKAVDEAGNSWERSIGFSIDTNPLGSAGVGVLLYLLLTIGIVTVALALLLWRRRKREEPEEQ
jgi:hypothetical protein